MVQHYEKQSSVDYSLKEGETLVLQLKNVSFHPNILLEKNESQSLFDDTLSSKVCKTII
jgi:hypothetical protein